MPKIRPFAAVRPVPALAAQVAALPYDVMNTEEARAVAQHNTHSFLHVDKAEIDLEPGVDAHAPQVYEKARDNLRALVQEGVLQQDKEPNFYIYQLTMGDHSQWGLVAGVAVDDYLTGVVKKHEFTRPDKEDDRVNHVELCNAQTGPIFLTHRDKGVGPLLAGWVESHAPVYDFVGPGGVGHRIWVVDGKEVQEQLVEAFNQGDSLYIADGHHRCAAAARVAQKRRHQNPHYSGDEEYNWFLAVIFPADQMQIMDYNRVILDLNGLSEAEFLKKIGEQFTIVPEKAPVRPVAKGSFGMHLGGHWYSLSFPDLAAVVQDPVAGLDVSILQDYLLAPILAIADPRTDGRIDFVGGIRGLGELEKRVDQGAAVAFSLFPTTIEEVMAIADTGQVMPPKSTWFEPKLLSGLFIHNLD